MTKLEDGVLEYTPRLKVRCEVFHCRGIAKHNNYAISSDNEDLFTFKVCCKHYCPNLVRSNAECYC